MENIKKNFELEKKIIEEISSLSENLANSDNKEERKIISSQIASLRDSFKKSGQGVLDSMEKISITKPLPQETIATQTKQPKIMQKMAPQTESPDKEPKFLKKKREKATGLEKLSLKRMKKKRLKLSRKKRKNQTPI